MNRHYTARGLGRCAVAAAVLPLLFLFFTASCTVQEEITVKSDFSGLAVGSIILDPLFVDYLSSFTEITGGGEDFSFDTETIKADLEKDGGVRVTSITSPDPERLSLSLAFDNIERLVAKDPSVSQAGLITVSQRNGVKRISIHLDRKNYAQLEALVPVLANPLFSALGPRENEGTSEAEYLEMMEYALGEDGPALIRRSAITARIRISGTLVAQKGGKPVPGGVECTIPLLTLLLLAEPIDLFVEFK